MSQDVQDALALQFAQIACDAGDIVMTPPRSATHKPDGSPVTAADKDAEQLIRDRLRDLMPELSVIAEESFDGTTPRQVPQRFVLVDPLDGTRDFIAGGDEFTVNIALIENGTPIAGSVYAPARKRLYFAGARAFRLEIEPGRQISTSALRPLA